MPHQRFGDSNAPPQVEGQERKRKTSSSFDFPCHTRVSETRMPHLSLRLRHGSERHHQASISHAMPAFPTPMPPPQVEGEERKQKTTSSFERLVWCHYLSHHLLHEQCHYLLAGKTHFIELRFNTAFCGVLPSAFPNPMHQTTRLKHFTTRHANTRTPHT